MSSEIFNYKYPIVLECGETLPEFKLAYKTYGSLNETRDNVIWVFHALTANASVDEWWSGLFGSGRVLDPNNNFIICVNMPGSCYGSISPTDINPLVNKPYLHQFPLITIRDMIRMYELLRIKLGIRKIAVALGGSMGGMQALEYAIEFPQLIDRLILIATNAVHSAWGRAWNASQRMAIESDATWQSKSPDAGMAGLRAARAIAMLSYRNDAAYNATQKESTAEKLSGFKSESYQYYQGEKLTIRFNAFSYYALTRSMDSHDAGRNRGGLEKALSRIKARTSIIGIESDLLFPLHEQLLMSRYIPGASFSIIDSDFGHDGFLIEYEQLSSLIIPQLKANTQFQLT
jgi:homoserine O-acetyltransferase